MCFDDSKMPQIFQKIAILAYFGHILGISNPLKHNMVLFLFQFQKALIYTVILRHQPAS